MMGGKVHNYLQFFDRMFSCITGVNCRIWRFETNRSTHFEKKMLRDLHVIYLFIVIIIIKSEIFHYFYNFVCFFFITNNNKICF